MPIEPLLRLVVIAAALAWAIQRFRPLARVLFGAAPEARLSPVGVRAWGVAVNVFGHARLLRKRYAGLLHLMMFTGFIVLLTAVIQVSFEGLSPFFRLAWMGGDTGIALLQDIATVGLLTAVSMALWQRLYSKPRRFVGSNGKDALIILTLVATVVTGMLLQNAFQVAAGADPAAAWRPLSSLLARGLIAIGFSEKAAGYGALLFAWVHMLAILAFVIYIPGSKHLHMLVGIPNVYARQLGPAGRLETPNLEAEHLGLSEVGQLKRKQVLDLFSCTECGRCQELCPANAAGKPLSPKLVIMDLRDHLLETSGVGGHREGMGGPLIGGVFSEETIWSCTTCRACMEACPLFIEHIPKLVDMRRHLAMEAGRVPEGISGANLSIEQRGHPWAGTPFSRVDWCRDLDLRILQPGERTDTLLWVGCTAALDSRAQKVARALVSLLKLAGVEFAILGDAEACTGDVARRTGNEYQFQLQATANVATLNDRQFRRIVTICPHCMNTLKNEYSDFGGHYQVLHHSELLDELIAKGRIPAGATEGVVFHDPCYLGRHNGEYEAPRAVLAGAGASVLEMELSRERSFCCGGGGGRAFAVEPPDQRLNTLRATQARASGAATIATACPFCLLMMEDGAKSAARVTGENTKPQQVRDIAEILASAIAPPSQAET